MKYVRLVRLLLKQNFLRELNFRGNFFLAVGTNALWFLIAIIFFGAIYLQSPSIGGWSMDETLMLLSVSEIVHLLYKGLLGKGVSRIPDLVRTGRLDHLLLKPVDSQFLVSFYRVDYYSLISLIFPLALFFRSLERLTISLTVGQIFAALALIFGSVFILYSVSLFIVSLSFWLTQVYALHALFQEVFSLSNYPESIYSGLLRIAFTFVFPIVIIANYPASFILHKHIGVLWLPVLFAVCVWGLLARRLWFYGLRHYSGASS